MKTIKINESQRQRLFEAYQEGFSLEYLSMIGRGQFAGEDNSKTQYSYCRKYLGEPIGRGSSRCVFQLSDNMVLKLAFRHPLGLEQNKNEFDVYNEFNSPLITRIYRCDENYTYLVCEHVLPASKEDFEKIVGITWDGYYWQESSTNKNQRGNDEEVGFDKYFDNIKPRATLSKEPCVIDIIQYIESAYFDGDINNPDKTFFNENLENIIEKNSWLSELKNLVANGGLYDLSLQNFGLVNRDGNPMIVILDDGLRDVA